MMHSKSTRLKLTHLTPHNPSKPVPVDPGTPSSGSSRSSIDTTKQSPLAESVNVPIIDSQKKAKTGKARVLTSNECIKALKEKEGKIWLAEEEKKERKVQRELKKVKEEIKHKKEEKAQKVAMKEAKQHERKPCSKLRSRRK